MSVRSRSRCELQAIKHGGTSAGRHPRLMGNRDIARNTSPEKQLAYCTVGSGSESPNSVQMLVLNELGSVHHLDERFPGDLQMGHLPTFSKAQPPGPGLENVLSYVRARGSFARRERGGTGLLVQSLQRLA